MNQNEVQPLCELCGEPMPRGEEMFKFHGYSGNCPKPPKAKPAVDPRADQIEQVNPDGAALIAEERRRQVSVEGFDHKHDNKHTDDEMAAAACCYAMPPGRRVLSGKDGVPGEWPWQWSTAWWKPSPKDRVRELVKAGALIAAEIDRLQRKEAAGSIGGGV